MAIDCLDEAIRMFGTNIYVYHEIVHNRYVVDRFTNQGVTFVEDLSQVPPGSLLYIVRTAFRRRFEPPPASGTYRQSTPRVPW